MSPNTIRTMIRDVAIKAKKKPMEAYMRHQYTFFGVPRPALDMVHKKIQKEYMISTYQELQDTVTALYSFKERECHYTAIQLLVMYKQLWRKESISLFERLIVTNSWWDTVDTISTKLIGQYFKVYPSQIPIYTKQWIQSDNIWKKRTAIIFQLGYKDTTDWSVLKRMCTCEAQNKELFIQTAIGWALRQYSKVNKQVVKDFVRNVPLHKRAKKEALIFIQGKTS